MATECRSKVLLNVGQKYYRLLQGEHSVILLTFIKLPFVIKIFVLSIFEWPFYSGFAVYHYEWRSLWRVFAYAFTKYGCR